MALKRNALIWLLVNVLVGLFLALKLPTLQFNSSLWAMLPTQGGSGLSPQLQQALTARLDTQVALFYCPEGEERDKEALKLFEALKALPCTAEVLGYQTPAQRREYARAAFQYRSALVDPVTRGRLESFTQPQWALAQLYSAAGTVSGAEFSADPLLLTRSESLTQLKKAGPLRAERGFLQTQDAQGRSWYFFAVRLAHSAFDVSADEQRAAQFNALRERILAKQPLSQLLMRGSVFYSAAAAAQSKADLSSLGPVSAALVLLCLMWFFKSARPVLLILAALGCGAVWGFAALSLIFDEIYLMTLVIAVSIIGMAVDDSLYYLLERQRHGRLRTPQESLEITHRAMMWSLITTVLAYLMMAGTPFPAVRQMSCFAILGLCGAFCTVHCLHPLCCGSLPSRQLPGAKLAARYMARWQGRRPYKYLLTAAILLLSLPGLMLLRVNDDVAALQERPPALVAEEERIGALSGQEGATHWFICTGKEAEQALQRCEMLYERLIKAQQEGMLSVGSALPYNSAARQSADLRLLQENLQKAAAILGDPDLSAGSYERAPSLHSYLKSPLGAGFKELVFEDQAGEIALLCQVLSPDPQFELNALSEDLSGVSLLDRRGAVSEMFRHYRLLILLIAAALLLLILLTNLARSGFLRGLRQTLPSALSCAAAAALPGYFGLELNFFTALSFILVLGAGINYVIMFSNRKESCEVACYGSALSLITTLLSLGVLIFSHTAALRGFGAALSAGLITVWLLSPWALETER